MSIDFNVLARLTKLIALLGFFLPWVAVSCSGNEIGLGTGWGLMTGHLDPSPQLAQMASEGGGDMQLNKHLDPDPFTMATFAVIAIGLIAGLLLRGRPAGIAMLITSVIGVGLCFVTFQHLQGALAHSMAEAQKPTAGGDEMNAMAESMRQSVAAAIHVDKKEGFWVTVLALGVTALFALGSAAGVRFTQAPAATPTG